MRHRKVAKILVVDRVLLDTWKTGFSRYQILKARNLREAIEGFRRYQKTLAAIVLGEEVRETGGKDLIAFFKECRASGFERPIVMPESREAGPEAAAEAICEETLRQIEMAAINDNNRLFLERFAALYDRANGYRFGNVPAFG